MPEARSNRTRLVAVRFTPNEYTQLEAMAHAAKVELSAYVRSVLVKAKVPQRAQGKSPDMAALGEALVALNRIGNNINQIAKQANLCGDTAAYHQAQAERAVLAAAAKAVLVAMEA